MAESPVFHFKLNFVQFFTFTVLSQQFALCRLLVVLYVFIYVMFSFLQIFGCLIQTKLNQTNLATIYQSKLEQSLKRLNVSIIYGPNNFTDPVVYYITW